MLEVQTLENSQVVNQARSHIDTIFLDMDGTLLDLHYDNYFWLDIVINAYAEKNALPAAQAKELLIAKFMQQRGTLEWYCVDYWTEQLDLNIMRLKTDINDKIRFRDGTEHFLKQAKSAGYRLVLATNAHRKVLDLKLQTLDFAHYFDALYSSHDFGVAKEHELFWPRLNEEFAFDKARAMFVDDSVSVLESAKTYGIKETIIVSQPDLLAPVRKVDELGGFTVVNSLVELFDVLRPIA